MKPSDLQRLIQQLKHLGYQLVPMDKQDVGAQAVIRGDHHDVVMVGMGTEENPSARTFRDIPIYVQSFSGKSAMEDEGGAWFCGGLYHFMRFFVAGEDISGAYSGCGHLPLDPDALLDEDMD